VTAQACSVAIDGHGAEPNRRPRPRQTSNGQHRKRSNRANEPLTNTHRDRPTTTHRATPTRKRRDQLVLSGVHRVAGRARRGSRPATAVPNTVGRTYRSECGNPLQRVAFPLMNSTVSSDGQKRPSTSRARHTANRRDERTDHNTRRTPSPRPGSNRQETAVLHNTIGIHTRAPARRERSGRDGLTGGNRTGTVRTHEHRTTESNTKQP
jgi:hypothetical protein